MAKWKELNLGSAQTETMTLRAGYENFFGINCTVSAAPSIENVKNNEVLSILTECLLSYFRLSY